MATARTRKPTGTAPGSRVDVRLEVPVADCSIVNAQGSRVVESGAFELLVGQRSRDRISCGRRSRSIGVQVLCGSECWVGRRVGCEQRCEQMRRTSATQCSV